MRLFESARGFQVLLATFALTLLTAAPTAGQSRDNPVCESGFSNLWKRDTRFLEIWWNEAKPVHIAECLEAGADPDARGILRHAAEWTRSPTVVQMLLEAGADPNAERGLDQTPLEVAESCSNASERDNIVRMLREAGAREP